MTIVHMTDGEIRADGHAGNRDACLMIEAAFQTTHRIMLAIGCASKASMTEAPPSFVIQWTSKRGEAVVAGLMSTLYELQQKFPDHVRIWI